MFKNPVIQEILEQIRVEDNLDGLVEFLSQDGVEYGRLIEVNTNGDGDWELIEANIT